MWKQACTVFYWAPCHLEAIFFWVCLFYLSNIITCGFETLQVTISEVTSFMFKGSIVWEIQKREGSKVLVYVWFPSNLVRIRPKFNYMPFFGCSRVFALITSRCTMYYFNGDTMSVSLDSLQCALNTRFGVASFNVILNFSITNSRNWKLEVFAHRHLCDLVARKINKLWIQQLFWKTRHKNELGRELKHDIVCR
jgi:hypothetical protein